VVDNHEFLPIFGNCLIFEEHDQLLPNALRPCRNSLKLFSIRPSGFWLFIPLYPKKHIPNTLIIIGVDISYLYKNLKPLVSESLLALH